MTRITADVNPLDRKLTVTFFRDETAATKTQRAFTLRDLVTRVRETTAPTKELLPWIKLAAFGEARTDKNSLRHKANVLAVDGVEGDYDGEVMTVDEACNLLAAADLAAVVYTSPSHQTHKPRWRVLAPLSETSMPEGRADHVGRLNGVLNGVLAEESFRLSQSYYFGCVSGRPAFDVRLVKGRAIDLATDLPVVRPVKAKIPPVRVTLGLALPSGEDRPAAVLAAARAMFTGQMEAGRHQVLLAATMEVAPYVLSGHLAESDVVADLDAAMAESGREPNDNEVESALAGALLKARPWEPPTGGAEFEAAEESTPTAAPSPTPPPPPPLSEPTEDAAMLGFSAQHGGEFAHDHDDQRWYCFHAGIGWKRDDDGAVARAMRNYNREQRKRWGDDKESAPMAKIQFSANVERACRSEACFAVTRAVWDADPFVIGVPGGAVDLRTGTLRPAARGQYVLRRTTVAPAEPGTPAPLSGRFLSEATGGDADMQAWLQRFFGYVLTGDCREEVLAFAYGPGGNGKGVFLHTLASILGPYAYQAPAELFKADSRTNREYQIANLDGVRLLIASETEAGSALAESFVKELSGNEGKMNGRQPYGRAFEFKPQAKLLIVGNHAPSLQGRSAAMQRRLKVLPFNHCPAQPDTDLKSKLVAEYPAILTWAITGGLDWQRGGLGESAAIKAASETYFTEQDSVALWIEDRCEVGDGCVTGASEALNDFNTWLRARGERPATSRGLVELLGRAPQIFRARSARGAEYRGIRLRTQTAGGSLSELADAPPSVH